MLEDRRCQAVLEGADLLAAVPLHVERLRDRGFNQSELLIEALSRGRTVRVFGDLVRARATRSQTDLSAAARRHNVRSAFAVRSDGALQGAIVVLVDDVTTTGATLRECARTLRRHGAAEVRSITVARAE
jgi:competence protein ComFC